MQRLKPTLNPTDDAEEEEQQTRALMEKKALANVKPFLLALFDDPTFDTAGLATADEGLDALGAAQTNTRRDDSTYAIVSRGQVPSHGFEESLRRETEKPQKLNFTPSTDRLPLHTKTVPPTFTRYPESGSIAVDSMMLLERRKPVSKRHGGGEESRSAWGAAAPTTNGAPPLPSGGVAQDAGTSSSSLLLGNVEARFSRLPDQYVPYDETYHNEEKLVKDSYLDYLMQSIQEAKTAPVQHPPVIW